MTPRQQQLKEIDQQLLRFAWSALLGVAIAGLLLAGGCYVGPPIHSIPPCEGDNPLMPCTGYCNLHLKQAGTLEERIVRYQSAVLIRDHAGAVHCQKIGDD